MSGLQAAQVAGSGGGERFGTKHRSVVAHDGGARWSLAPTLAMSLDGTRREAANDNAPEHGVQFRLTVRW